MNWRILPLAALLVAGTACTGGGDAIAPAPVFDPPTVMERQSLSSTGDQGNAMSFDGSVSGSGEFTYFTSDATNLVQNDTNGVADVFLRDRFVRVTVRASVSDTETQANGASGRPSANGDGSQVAFSSVATNLVANDTNGFQDVFVRNLAQGTTSLVSTDSGGNLANGPSALPALSSSGLVVAFESVATNLVANDTNGVQDVFVKNRATGVTLRASTDLNGNQANGPSRSPVISADGGFVAFESDATNLVPNDTNGVTDVFLKNLNTGEVVRVSTDGNGNQANAASFQPAISGNAAFVGFASFATNLVPNDTNAVTDVFVKQITNGATTRASVDSNGNQANGGSVSPALNFDGSRIAFESVATNLVTNDTNGFSDIFVKTFVTAATQRVSVSVSGTQSDGNSFDPALSFSGVTAVFESVATNLVQNDTNGVMDVFATPVP